VQVPAGRKTHNMAARNWIAVGAILIATAAAAQVPPAEPG